MSQRGIYAEPYDPKDGAQAFREAISRGWQPLMLTAERFNVRPSVAIRMNHALRADGRISDADWIAGMTLEGHASRAVGWDDSPERWLACRTCRTPWPCETFDVEVRARREAKAT